MNQVRWNAPPLNSKELLPLRIQQCERSAVRCGDGVYVLAWEPSKNRVLLRTYDPGFYFPEWDEGEQDSAEYPSRVHLAGELPADPIRGLKARVRRITYELGAIGAATAPGRTDDGRAIREVVLGAEGEPVLTVGDTSDAVTGTVSRTYPWAPGKPSSMTCYLTDAEWLLEDLGRAHDVFSLPAGKAAYRVRSDGQVLDRLDLMCDFILGEAISPTFDAIGGANRRAARRGLRLRPSVDASEASRRCA